MPPRHQPGQSTAQTNAFFAATSSPMSIRVRAIAKAGADGVIVASALVDALGEDGRDVAGLARLMRELRVATIR